MSKFSNIEANYLKNNKIEILAEVKGLLLVMILCSLWACTSVSSSSTKSKTDLSIVENAIGLVELVSNDKQNFIYYDEKKKAHSKLAYSENLDIEPYTYHNDYYLFMLRCLEKTDSNYYKVVIDEETEKIAYIKLEDGYKFKTWENYILGAFAIGHSIDYQPRELPSSESAIKKNSKFVYEDSFFKPIEIKGDWVKVEYEFNEKIEYAWIQWRDKNKLIIEVFHFA